MYLKVILPQPYYWNIYLCTEVVVNYKQFQEMNQYITVNTPTETKWFRTDLMKPFIPAQYTANHGRRK